MRRRRKDATNPPCVERIESLNINTEYIETQRERERERERETNVCVRTWNGIFFSLNRSFLWFYEEKGQFFLEKKLSEKKSTFGQNWALYE